MYHKPPGFAVHGISQARYWNTLPLPPPGDLPNPKIEVTLSCISCIDRLIFFTICATWKKDHLSCSCIWSSSRPFLAVYLSLSQDGFVSQMFLGGWQDLHGPVSPPLFWLLPSSSSCLQVVSSLFIIRTSYCDNSLKLVSVDVFS